MDSLVQSFIEGLEKELEKVNTENSENLKKIQQLETYQQKLLDNFDNLGMKLCDSCKSFNHVVACTCCNIQFCNTCTYGGTTRCQGCRNLYCQECILDKNNSFICGTCDDWLCSFCISLDEPCKSCGIVEWKSI